MAETNPQILIAAAVDLVRRADRQGLTLAMFESALRQTLLHQPKLARSLSGESLAALFATLPIRCTTIARGMDGRLYWNPPCDEHTADGKMRNQVSQQVDDIYLVFECMRQFQRINGHFTVDQISRALSHQTGSSLSEAVVVVNATLDHFSGMLTKAEDGFRFIEANPHNRADTMNLFRRLCSSNRGI